MRTVIATALAAGVVGGLGLSVSAEVPACGAAGGNPFLSFAYKTQQIVTWQGTPYQDYYVTMGLENLTIPDHLIMESGGYLIVSRDQGCEWELVERLPGGEWPLWITPGPQGYAYAYAVNGSALYQVSYDAATREFAATSRRIPSSGLLGLGVSATDPLHIRIGDAGGQMHESFDGGETWFRVGMRAPVGLLTYRAAFDPGDLDHVMYGEATHGGWVTFDGGATWEASSGLSSSDGPANLFNMEFSPVDGLVVWAMSLDVNESDQGHPSQGRHIYRSTDGGRTFEPRIDNGPGVTITNGPELTPHPYDADRMAWAWGSRFDGMYVYQYDNGLDRLVTGFRAGLVARTACYYLPDTRHLYVGMEAR